MKLFPLILIILFLSTYAQAQVKHNFEKGPENTNCHELPQTFKSKAKAIELIEASTFRFKESIKISRYRIPQSADYYSCNGKTGFLIAKESDNSTVVYSDIDLEIWKEFTNSSDPIAYYKDKIKNSFSSKGKTP